MPKYYLESVTNTLKPGWSFVLSLVLTNFPRLRLGDVDLTEVIDFLNRPETKQRRKRIFDWYIAMGQRIEETHELIADGLSDYISWIKSSGLATGVSAAEFLVSADPCTVRQLTELSSFPCTAFHFRKRGLASTGPHPQEIAYVSHGTRQMPSP